MLTNSSLFKLATILISVAIFSVANNVNAQEIYVQEELFTIPWGNQTGELSLWWHEEPPPFEEGRRDPPLEIGRAHV